MTKKELVKEIGKRVREIRELYYSVYPKGDYLNMYFEKNFIGFNNENWRRGIDENYPINYDERNIRMNKGCDEKKC